MRGTPGVRMTAPTGRVLATSLDGDLLLRALPRTGERHDAGDQLRRALQLRDWDGLPALLAGQVDYDARREAARQRTNLNPTGISDLQTQVLGTTNQFPEVSRPSYWSSLGLIVLAFLVIGPIDYFLVHHLLRRRTWTWFTLDRLVALLTFGGSVRQPDERHCSAGQPGRDRRHRRDAASRSRPELVHALQPGNQRVDITVDPDKTWPVRDIQDREGRWSGPARSRVSAACTVPADSTPARRATPSAKDSNT